MSAHCALRPKWLCAACGGPWPCFTRRQQLAAEYEGAPTSLSIYLAKSMVEAAYDLPDRPAGLIYEQFLGWLGPPLGRGYPLMALTAVQNRGGRPYIR